jgi:Flp pilus assembly protein TadG
VIGSARLLRRDAAGAVTIEFALLSTVFIGLLLGVLQVGIGMQSYNAVRNVSADVARYTMVQYETGNKLSNSQIQFYAISAAKSAPYLLQSDGVNAKVDQPATQRVTGAKELTLTMEYQIPSILQVIGVAMPKLSYEQPIFLITT